MIEHMSTGEEENANQAQACPEISVLQDGNNIRSCDSDEGDNTENGSGDGCDLYIVDGPDDRWFSNISGEVSGDPSMNDFSWLRAM
jgi:hypothetical protein